MTRKERERLLQKDEFGRTPLFLCKNARQALKLIAVGVNANEIDKTGRTALFFCNNKPDLLTTLIEHGADASVVDGDGENALFGCLNREAAQILIEHGADAGVVSKDGRTALFGCQDANTARILIEHGADAKSIDTTHGQNALFDCRNADVAELLIEHGADAAIVDRNGQTPLFAYSTWADKCMHGDFAQAERITRILVKHGANINAVDSSGYSAVDYSDYGFADLLFLLGAELRPNSPWQRRYGDPRDGRIERSHNPIQILHL